MKESNESRKPSERDKIKGVFSTQSLAVVGTGSTKRKTIQKTYWFVQEIDATHIEVQPLNVNYVPSGPKKVISKEDFLQKFSPEPEFYTYTVFPKMRELNTTIARGERHRSRGETFSAEMEFGNALKVDEENIRANFGLGLTYLERGETTKANDIFQRLVNLDAAFEQQHKHLFNDFGINLRKNKMYTQAVEYYSRALKLTDDDENLHYNIARAFFERGKMEKAVHHLKKALELNPDLSEAKQFLEYMKTNGLSLRQRS
ncbi:MAG: tetratricopeptide repeat protein [Desulfovibrionales bacterium]